MASNTAISWPSSLLLIISVESKCTHSLKVICKELDIVDTYLLVVERVDVLEEPLYQILWDDSEPLHQCAELGFIYHTVVIGVDATEFLSETAEELLMLPQLEVEDRLQEEVEFELILGGALLNGELSHLVSCQLLVDALGNHLSNAGSLNLRSCLKHGEGIWLNLRIPEALVFFIPEAIHGPLRSIILDLVTLETDPIVYLSLELPEVFLIVHLLNDLPPLPLVYGVSDYRVVKLLQVVLALIRVLLSQDSLEQREHSLLNSLLDESEFLVALVAQDFPEKCHVMILLAELLDARDDGGGPFYNQVLQTVPLIQVGVHVLLHGFFGLLALLAFEVELHFLSIHVRDKLFKLFQGESSLLSGPKRHG